MTQLPSVKIPVSNSKLSLRKNFTWTFAGNAIYAASQWGQLVVLAKLGSPETVGQFAFALAVCAPVIMFANLQLRSVQATDARHDYKFADYFGLRLMTTGAAYLVIVAIVILSGYQQQTALVILLIGLSKCFEAVSDIIFGLLQQQERMDRIAKSLIIEGPLTLVVMVIVMYLTHNIVWATTSLAIVWGLQLAFYDIPSALLILRAQSSGYEWQLMRPRFKFTLLRPLIWLALPLGFVALLTSLTANIPRYIIEIFLGKQQLGIFAALVYVVMAQNILMNALGQAAMPLLSKNYIEKWVGRFARLLLKMITLVIALGALGFGVSIVFGYEALKILYGTAYAQESRVLTLLMISAMFTNVISFVNYGIMSTRKFRVQLPLTLIAAILTALCCLLMVRESGLVGIVIGTIGSLTLQSILSIATLLYILHKVQKQARN